jgi:hypothetical protein
MAGETIVAPLIEGGKGAVVPLGVTAIDFMGIQLSEWVYILTIIYLIVHIGYIAYKWIKGK